MTIFIQTTNFQPETNISKLPFHRFTRREFWYCVVYKPCHKLNTKYCSLQLDTIAVTTYSTAYNLHIKPTNRCSWFRKYYACSSIHHTPFFVSSITNYRFSTTSNPQLCWDLCHSEFWLDNIVIQTRSGSATRTHWPCTYCGSTYHFSDQCPRSPFHPKHQDSIIGT